MRFIKAITGKIFDEVEDLFGSPSINRSLPEFSWTSLAAKNPLATA